MAQLKANGIDLEYDTFGNPDHEPVLLIMGLGTQMTAWTPEFCSLLADEGYYVIRFDNRDVGLSTKFDGIRAPGPAKLLLRRLLRFPVRTPYSLRDMAHDALGVLDALDIKAAHVVGASMGGMIAQLAAFHHPDRVLSLTSIMSSSGEARLPRTRRDVARHIFYSRPRTRDREAMMAHLVKSMQLISSSEYPRAEAEWREIIAAAMKRSAYPQGFTRQLAAIVADGSRARRLARIRVRTLVLHGSADPLVPIEHGKATARHVPNARLEVIDGMGHDLPPQLYGRIVDLIAGHLQG